MLVPFEMIITCDIYILLLYFFNQFQYFEGTIRSGGFFQRFQQDVTFSIGGFQGVHKAFSCHIFLVQDAGNAPLFVALGVKNLVSPAGA